MVEVGAVQAVGVDDVEFAIVTTEFGVQAADGDVIEVDIATGMAAPGGNASMSAGSAATTVGSLNSVRSPVVGSSTLSSEPGTGSRLQAGASRRLAST